MSDFASIFNNSFQQAATRKQDRTLGELFQQGDLQGASDYAFSKGRNGIGMQLRAQVQQQRAQADERQRAEMDARLQRIGGLAAGLQGTPAEQRMMVVNSSPFYREQFAALGIPADQITADHVSDANLAAYVGLARGAGDTQTHALDVRKQDEVERSARASEADALRDDQRADLTAGHYTLAPGSVRYGPDGKALADNPRDTSMTDYQRAQLDLQRARLAHDKAQAARGGAGGAKRSLSPIFGHDAEGNYTAAQLTADGQLIPAQAPDGFTLQDPFGKAQGRAAGTALGKGAAARELGLPAQARQLETFRADFAALQDRVKLAKSQTNWRNTGPAGRFNPLATDLDGTLETIRANAGFDKLQEMRDNSPTGGAVGQVSNIELRGLQSAWGNVQRSQSEEQLDRNLDAFEKRYAQMLDRMEDAYRQDMAAGLFGPAPSAPAPSAPDPRAAQPQAETDPGLPPGFVMD